MLHASSWLVYCWDFADIADSSSVFTPSTSASDDGAQVGTVRSSRREEFRLAAGGPSRQELQWLQIISILRKIHIPSFMLRSDGTGQEQLKCEKVSGSFGVVDSVYERPSSVSVQSMDSVEVVHVEAEKEVHGSVHPTSPFELNRSCYSHTTTTSSIPSINSSKVARKVNLKEVLRDVSWPFTAVSDMAKGMDSLGITWADVPESADPMRGSGYKKAPSPGLKFGLRGKQRWSQYGDGRSIMERGERKRLQIENIASALNSFHLKAGSKVVDFGCGSGALTLPLAALFPQLLFIGVDFKQRSITLLEERALKADLQNVSAFHERIENFSQPFDACVALHACGIATDLALLQALKHQAAYVMSPCCIGKLQLPFGKVLFNNPKIVHSVLLETADNSLSSIRQNPTHNLRSLHPEKSSDLTNFERPGCNLPRSGNSNKGVEPNLYCSPQSDVLSRQSSEGPLTHSITGKESISMTLTYPRSRWLQSSISETEFQLLARAADWSSYDHESCASRLHTICKIILELDRNEASRELGYSTGLFSLSNKNAGSVGVSHILVGKPEGLPSIS